MQFDLVNSRTFKDLWKKFKDFQAPVLFSSTFKSLNLGEKIKYFQRCVGTLSHIHHCVQQVSKDSISKQTVITCCGHISHICNKAYNILTNTANYPSHISPWYTHCLYQIKKCHCKQLQLNFNSSNFVQRLSK